MKTLKIFYTRVSTEDQSELRQLKDTEKGFDYVLGDKCSGTIPLWDRPRGKQIKELIDQDKVKEIHIHSIDRLGRNTLDVLGRWKELTDLGVRIVCRKPNLQNIDVDQKTDPFSQLLLEILTSMSSFEKSLIDMRRSEGIERTKKLHPERYSGRKIGSIEKPENYIKKLKSTQILKDLENGYGVREISKMRDCSFSTIYKVKRISEQLKTQSV
jgi:DNA invertase Pin-like site-specific DNA recombinase